MVTFRVDDVEPAPKPPGTRSLAEHLSARSPLAMGAPERRVLTEATGDGLLAAVHHAYADHHPLVLTPDAIWLTILRGVAHHVRRHAERLRGRLVQHEGTRVLELELPDRRPEDPRWTEGVVSALSVKLAESIGEGPARLCLCDFSTSTAIERTASEVLLLDLYSPFFEYRLGIICGIPEITVEGTPPDWRSIRARLDVIEELELSFWTRHLKPIVDRLIDAAEGRPDRAFFQRIYKPKEAYGPDLITGWVGWLYPYLGAYAEQDNPLLAYAIDEALPASTDDRGYWSGPAIRPSDVPTMLGTCDLDVRTHGVKEQQPLHLEAGIGAVELRADGSLCPAAVWMIFEGVSPRRTHLDGLARLHAVLDRVASGVTTPGSPRTRRGRPLPPTDELGQLYARFETATFGTASTATLLPFEEDDLATIPIDGTRTSRERTYREQVEWLMPVFQLSDGSVLACASNGAWARLDAAKVPPAEAWDITGLGHVQRRRPPYPDHASEIPVVAESLRELLEHLLSGAELPTLTTVQRRFEATQ